MSERPGEEAGIRPADLKAELAIHLDRDRKRWLAGRRGWVGVPCPACGGDDHESFTVRDYPFATCSGCGTVYQNPRPTSALLAEYYASAESYTFWAERIFPATEECRRETIARPLARMVADAAAGAGAGRNVLVEIGAGAGLFLDEMRTIGRYETILAVEPTPALAAVLRRREFEVVESDYETAEMPELRADLVCAFEVIEHLFDPAAFLGHARRWLVPGGILAVSCPNIHGFDFQVLGLDRAENFGLEHINMFHPGSLGGLLTRCGFEILETRTPGRLDADLVRQQALAGKLDLSRDPFLRRILIEEWESLGGPFQQFLQDNLMSSNMLLIARSVPVSPDGDSDP